MTADFPYVYRRDGQGRKGQRCRVLARGTMDSCCVEFEDGYKMITSRKCAAEPAVRRQSRAAIMTDEREERDDHLQVGQWARLHGGSGATRPLNRRNDWYWGLPE